MPNFPYFGFPFSPFRRYNYSSYNGSNNFYDKKMPNNAHEKISSNANSSSKIDEEAKNSINNEPYLFDLFGLKLYFDDILLICLIFFLYNEGVKDEGLFFALILLLLT